MEMYKANDNRYADMAYRRCGRSGLLLPAISLGLWHNFGSVDAFSNFIQIAHAAFDNGITHFDLANNYGPAYGSAEKNFGRILKEDLMPYRDELIITTKAGFDMWEGPYGNWGSRKYLLASLDQSLKRMGLEYVDIFYHHRMDTETPLEETMGALADIVRSGKALYAGVSNYNEEYTRKASEILKSLHCPFIVNQRRYSIFDREIEHDGVKYFCKENGIGIIAFSPLAQGLLTDKYMNGIPEDSRIKRDGRFLKPEAISEAYISKVKALNRIAADRGQTLAQMALSWILKDEDVCSVLVGASSPKQIEEDAKIVGHTEFQAAELEQINEIVHN